MAKITVESIGYVSTLVEPYAQQAKNVKTLAALKALVNDWELLAGDALDRVSVMTEKDFVAYEAASKKEKKGKFAGLKAAQQFGMIWMPETLVKISMVAHQYTVPDGCAFIRLKEFGRLTIKDNRAVIDLNGDSPKKG
jgi:hypothetical protein